MNDTTTSLPLILGYQWTDLSGRITHRAKTPPDAGACNLEPILEGAEESLGLALSPEELADCVPNSAVVNESPTPGRSSISMTFQDCKEFAINVLLRHRRLPHLVQQSNPEEVWDRFIEHLNKARPLPDEARHKNFLGSIEHYKKVFLESAKQPELREKAPF